MREVAVPARQPVVPLYFQGGSRMRTLLELFLCGFVQQEGVLYHKTTKDITGSAQDPDAHLAEMLQVFRFSGGKDDCCAHSTSWRYDDGGIVLTYLTLVPMASLVRLPTTLVRPFAVKPTVAAGPLQPRPVNLLESQVVIHGLGHLHYLSHTRREPFMAKTAKNLRGLSLLASFAPTVAGRLQYA